MLTSLPSLDSSGPKQKSVTETLSPLYRKLSGLKFPSEKAPKKSQITLEVIRDEYSILSSTVDSLENALNERLDVHERELMKIMRLEIEKMLDDVRKVVKVFNIMIKEKNFSQDLWETKNEVEYFKFEAFRLFQENKSLKRQIGALRQQIQSLNFQEKCQTIALKKMAKRLVRQKAKRNGLSQYLADQKSTDNQQQKSLLTSTRKRHESLYSTLQKNASKLSPDKSTPIREDYPLKNNNIQSTISHTGKDNKFKTEEDENPSYILNKDLKPNGNSEKIMLFNNQGRSDKMKLLKQRASLCKNRLREYKNEQQIDNWEKQ